MYYTEESKNISAKWIDSNKLEIIHEPNLTFDKKEKESFFRGDKVIIKYKTE